MVIIKIYIATGDKNLLNDIKNVLNREGYSVVGTATHAAQVLRDARAIKTNLFLLDSNLQGISGLELAEIINDLNIPIIVLSDTWKDELATAARKGLIHSIVIKPVTSTNLYPAVETALAAHQEVVKLRKEVDILREKLETRKIVEKAKGVLMKGLGLSEDEAYKRIRSESMNQSRSLKEVAEAILTSKNILEKRGGN